MTCQTSKCFYPINNYCRCSKTIELISSNIALADMAALQQMCINLLLIVKSPTDALYSLCVWPLLKTLVPSFFRKSFGIYYRLKFISVTCCEGIPFPVGTNRPEKSESTETQVFSLDAYSSFTFDKCQASLIRYNGNNKLLLLIVTITY